MTWAEVVHGLLRGLHMAATMCLFGTALACSVIAPAALLRSPAEARRAVQRRLAQLVLTSLIVATLGGGGWLLAEAWDLVPEETVSSALATVPVVLLDTHFGTILIARLALLLLAGLPFAAGRADGWASHGAALLSGAAVGLQAGLGHGVSMGGSLGIELTTTEVLHLLSAGAWLGGLPALLVVIQLSPTAAASDSVGRFSRLGVACVTVLAATICFQAWVLIGNLAGLVGTDYGQVALVKLALFLALMVLAASNRFLLAPALAGGEGQLGRRRLIASVALETLVGAAAILAAGVLLRLEPAMHQQPYWPFSSRLSLDILWAPSLRHVMLKDGMLLLTALAMVGVAIVIRRRAWIPMVPAIFCLSLTIPDLQLLLVPAYPTSFYRSSTGFTSAAIVKGAELFPANCAGCHGTEGRGDGPLAGSLSLSPTDLTASGLFDLGDGDLFWWLSHGIEGSNGELLMPGFADRLTDQQLWELIDYIRAHNVGLTVTTRGEWGHPILAPDATVAVDGKLLALRSLRGRLLRVAAVGKIFTQPAPLSPEPGLSITTVALSPGSDAWNAYAIVSGIDPENLDGCEFLVDPQGWLRRVLKPSGFGRWLDQGAFLDAAKAALSSPVQAPDMDSMQMGN